MSPNASHRAASAPLPVRRAAGEIAQHVVTWRKLSGLTQKQLADRSGVARGTVGRLEAADMGVSLENVLRVLRALGLLGTVSHALDPLESDVGRLRAGERLPQRVRPRKLGDLDA